MPIYRGSKTQGRLSGVALFLGQAGLPLAAQALVLDNGLEGCLTISDGQIQQHDNLLVYTVRLTLSESIGSCGCTSARAAYEVRQDGQLLRRETLLLRHSRQAALLLSAEGTPLPAQALSLRLGCAAPD